MEFKIMEACDVARLAAFEKLVRMTEPGSLFGQIEEEEFARAAVERMADPIYSNTRVALALDGDWVLRKGIS